MQPRVGAPGADIAAFVARLLLAVLFLGGAVQKVSDPAPAQLLLTGYGLPGALVWPAMLYNAGAGLCLIAGRWVRPTALSLAGYCAVTSLFHWVPEDPWQISIFVKNWAIAGGCCALYALGPGRYRL